VGPSHCFNSKVVGTKSEACHAANDATRKIKEHVSSKGAWQMCVQGPLYREGAPLMISGVFAAAPRCVRDAYEKKLPNNPSASP